MRDIRQSASHKERVEVDGDRDTFDRIALSVVARGHLITVGRINSEEDPQHRVVREPCEVPLDSLVRFLDFFRVQGPIANRTSCMNGDPEMVDGDPLAANIMSEEP